jgi:hypothetical protein
LPPSATRSRCSTPQRAGRSKAKPFGQVAASRRHLPEPFAQLALVRVVAAFLEDTQDRAGRSRRRVPGCPRRTLTTFLPGIGRTASTPLPQATSRPPACTKWCSACRPPVADAIRRSPRSCWLFRAHAAGSCGRCSAEASRRSRRRACPSRRAARVTRVVGDLALVEQVAGPAAVHVGDEALLKRPIRRGSTLRPGPALERRSSREPARRCSAAQDVLALRLCAIKRILSRVQVVQRCRDHGLASAFPALARGGLELVEVHARRVAARAPATLDPVSSCTATPNCSGSVQPDAS